MLKYTGHPILDVGIATITAFANKESPEKLTEADLEAIADYMAANYPVPPLRGFLTVAFPNSGFTQPAYFKSPEKQKIYSDRVLYAFREDTPVLDEQGVFMNLPAADVPFDVKGTLEPGKVFRQHLPMQTGEGIINFHPAGEAGLPISGEALLAFQAYPLGSAKCAGRTLSVHSDSPEIILYFARRFLEENRKTINLAQAANSKKMPESHLKYRTLLISTLLEARQMQLESIDFAEPFSITAYHLTNLGQNADLAIYHLPSQIVSYLQTMYSADYRTAWGQIVRQGWALPKLKRGQKESPPDFKPDRNWLYEDLFRLAENVPEQAPRFIRTYFLREPLLYAQKDKTDPRDSYSTKKQSRLVSWKLTEPFLRRVMHMDASRIEKIRSLGDALAEYVKTENDKRFFRNFYVENRYGNFRNTLIKANTAHVKGGHAPFLTFEVFIAVFEDGEDLARIDWRLARDLVFIRMVEKLHANGWLGENQDAILEEDESES